LQDYLLVKHSIVTDMLPRSVNHNEWLAVDRTQDCTEVSGSHEALILAIKRTLRKAQSLYRVKRILLHHGFGIEFLAFRPETCQEKNYE
jgi:hypothetical protein